MGIIGRIFEKFKTRTFETTISVIGPSKAGKTTLVRYLETGKEVKEDPLSTLGVDYRTKPLKIDSASINVIDVGGQKLYQDAFWDYAVEQSDGVIYLIDSIVRPENDARRFTDHLQQFEYFLDILPEDVVLMILLNKQDLKVQDPMSPEEMFSFFPLKALVNRTASIIPTSAKYGDGIQDALEWFVKAISNKR